MDFVFLAELVTVAVLENAIGAAIWLDSSDPFTTDMITLGDYNIKEFIKLDYPLSIYNSDSLL